jgi:hypothetical protein
LNKIRKHQSQPSIITFYHDTEQNYDSNADPLDCRSMVNEFLKLEKKYNVSTTYNVVGKLFKEQPDLIDNILNEGQEVAFHSYNHQTDWNSEYYLNEIGLCRKVSKIPTGYRSPRSQINQSAVHAIWENGFLWNAEGDYHSEPYFIYEGLVRLPITGDDWPIYLGEVTADKWIHNFAKILKSRTYIAFGLHDYIASFDPEKILGAWEKILQIGIESGALILNFSETAEYYRRSAVSKYLKSRKGYNNKNKAYFPAPFEALIKKEAELLNDPVMANLYYVNKKIPATISNSIKAIYYIPVDSGIIEDLESKDLKSQKKFADLIICANCIEYQFRPANLLNIIKQIGKIGATYIVIFPLSEDEDFPSNDSVLDRIKHYFSKDEIQDWANQLGPANIICLNDNKNNNWVVIGKIQNQKEIVQERKIISISEIIFLFPNPFFESIRINIEVLKGKLIKIIRIIGKKIPKCI